MTSLCSLVKSSPVYGLFRVMTCRVYTQRILVIFEVEDGSTPKTCPIPLVDGSLEFFGFFQITCFTSVQ